VERAGVAQWQSSMGSIPSTQISKASKQQRVGGGESAGGSIRTARGHLCGQRLDCRGEASEQPKADSGNCWVWHREWSGEEAREGRMNS
jgi:hypothetical protein